MSGADATVFCLDSGGHIQLHLLQFLCGDSDYFRVSVTVAQCRARRLGYTDWKGLESITAANISTGMRKIFSHTDIHIWDSVCDEYYVTQTYSCIFGTVCVMNIMSHRHTRAYLGQCVWWILCHIYHKCGPESQPTYPWCRAILIITVHLFPTYCTLLGKKIN